MKPQLEREFEQKKMLEYMDGLRSKADVKVMLPEDKASEAKPAEEQKAEEPKAEEKK